MAIEALVFDCLQNEKGLIKGILLQDTKDSQLTNGRITVWSVLPPIFIGCLLNVFKKVLVLF